MKTYQESSLHNSAGHETRALRFWVTWLMMAIGFLVWSQCDTVVPDEEARLVVEAFIESDQPLAPIRLWRTVPLNRSYPFDASTAVSDAEVRLTIGGSSVAYEPISSSPGWYQPTGATPFMMAPRTPLSFEAEWGTQRATAESMAPPIISIDDVRIKVPDEPVDGIILDSLFFDPVKLDSLQIDSLRTGAEQGLVYLIEVEVAWSVDFVEIDEDSSYWVRTQLKPSLPSGATLEDFFFKPEQVFRERNAERDSAGMHSWIGVYAVPVQAETDALPSHSLRVSLIRSRQDYAQFVATRGDPEQREPASNVSGGIGIVAGLSIDSLRVQVE